MSTKGRTRKPESQRTGHRKAVGETDAVEVARVEAHLLGATPPEDLSDLAKECWGICITDMAVLGHLREPDLLLLRGYAQTAAIMVEAEAAIHVHGAMMQTPIMAYDPIEEAEIVVGYKLAPNPAVKMHGEALNRLRLMSTELGLNPLARIRGNLLQAATASIALGVRDNIVAAVEAAEAAEKAASRKTRKRAPAKKRGSSKSGG